MDLTKPKSVTYTPMMEQYLQIKKDYTDFIVFFRLGDFYEMFFTDAIVASKELEIVLTGRDAGQEERVPMCGVPFHAANVYVERLVDKGYKIAIVEQVEDPALAKGIVKREVIKLITPGTMIEEGFVDEKSNNFIGALGETKTQYLLATCDITTGQNALITMPKDIDIVLSEIHNLAIKELVIPSKFDQKKFKKYIDTYPLTLSVSDQNELLSYYRSLISEIYDKDQIETFSRLVNYLLKTQKKELMHLQKVQLFESKAYLRIDHHSKQNLELIETLRAGYYKGSLFWLLDRCQTAMGSRYLKQTILRPLVDAHKIEQRFDFIEAFNTHFLVKDDITQALKTIYDLERIIGRLSFGNANAKDLVNLARSLSVLPTLQASIQSLNNEELVALTHGFDSFEALVSHIQAAIVDEPPLSIKEGGIIRPGYDATLDEWKNLSTHGKDWIETFEQQEKERTGIKKLKVGYNRVFGYYIEITQSQLDLVDESFGYVRKQTLSNSERFITPELKEKEALILHSEEASIDREYELFVAIRDEAKALTEAMQKAARAIAEIDMVMAFAKVSQDNRYCRPAIVSEQKIEVYAGRHPVVEKMMGPNEYVPNDLFFDEKTKILLITGPNMSGKSTYMRQLALHIIMMQMGCFVSADVAKLPLFDQIFTRMGATDDLSQGKSTFMVEMLEVNDALQNATEKSLILFDEIGRGTATYDGMALAQAIIEYIHSKIRCKVLFSTHYHELTYLEDELKGLQNIHVMAKEEKGSIVFLHKVAPGPTDRSYGIHVAQLAKMPKLLIERAKTILTELETNHGYNVIKPVDLNLFNFEAVNESVETDAPYQSIIDQLKSLDLNNLTPLAAMNILADVIKDVHALDND